MHNSVLSLALFVLKKKKGGGDGGRKSDHLLLFIHFWEELVRTALGRPTQGWKCRTGFHFITFAVVKPWPLLH